MTGFLLFHLNLAFSSIEHVSQIEVIDRCYARLFDLIDKSEVKTNIELTGYTLERINFLAPSLVSQLKNLQQKGLVEIIASGFFQSIFPLFPYKLNKENIGCGINCYQKILGVNPNYVMANELAFSKSFIDVALECGFDGVILEKNNVESIRSKNKDLYLENIDSFGFIASTDLRSKIKVRWINSISFQKFQQVIHGAISFRDYESYMRNLIQNDQPPYISIYGSDAEVFNYRPGRFDDESKIERDEWELMDEFIEFTRKKLDISYELVSQIGYVGENKVLKKPTNLRSPIAVKKQLHYNISRWAVTGRSDVSINTATYKLARLLETDSLIADDYKAIFDISSSDYRTHITSKRWSELRSRLKQSEMENGDLTSCVEHECKELSQDSFFFENEKVGLMIKPLNKMVIDKLTFYSSSLGPFIKSFGLGYFKSIDLANSYECGMSYFLTPSFKKGNMHNNTLSNVRFIEDHERFFIIADSTSKNISYSSFIQVEHDNSGVVHLGLIIRKPIYGQWIARLFNLYFDVQHNEENYYLWFHSGGQRLEMHQLFRESFDHTKPASFNVSCNGGFAATEGVLYISSGSSAIKIEWDNSKYFLFPQLRQEIVNNETLFSICFSISEIDETSTDHVIPEGRPEIFISSCQYSEIN